jgi:hypothetical protein
MLYCPDIFNLFYFGPSIPHIKYDANIHNGSIYVSRIRLDCEISTTVHGQLCFVDGKRYVARLQMII